MYKFKHHKSRLVAIVATAGFFLSACGGGGGSGSIVTPSSTTGAKSVVTTGTISGFGSVIVNGVHYDTSKAQIETGGRSGTQADLKVGDVVQLKGKRDANGGNASAERIVHRNAVTGPISAVDATTNRVTVLGQTVLVTASTSFDDSIVPADFTGLKVDDVIEVNGLPNASAQIEATRIEKAAAGATWEVIGKASATDTTAKTFKLNDLVVDYSTATLSDFASGAPKDGDAVEVKGTTLNASGALVATSVEFLGNKDLRPDDAAGEVEIEGMVTRFVSATDFDVANKPVTTNGSTVYRNGTVADIVADARLEVEGTLDANGVLVASKVEFKRESNIRITATIDSIDTAANTFKVLGIDVTVDASTRVEDHGDGKSQFFKFSDLKVGDAVEVRGIESPAGSGKVLAQRLEREKALKQAEIRGPVASVARPNFNILAATVATTDTTVFEQHDAPITADAFFGLTNLVGTSVDARGTLNGTVFTATKVEIDGHDED